eukprot:evm.model.scf_2111.1 EVM.evm.TU.scf_2111.1   scf_2111:7138-18005(+)
MGGRGRGRSPGRGPGPSRGQGRGYGQGREGGRRGPGSFGPGAFGPVPKHVAEKMMMEALQGLTLTCKPQAHTGDCVKRPSIGTVGRPVNVMSNFFQMWCSAGAAHHYDVAIVLARRAKEGEEGAGRALIPVEGKGKMPWSVCRRVMMKMSEGNMFPGGWAFDGNKNAYTSRPIKKEFLNTANAVRVYDMDTGKEKHFLVTIRVAATIDVKTLLDYVSPKGREMEFNQEFKNKLQDGARVLDIVLRHASAMNEKCQPVGRSLYFRNSATKTIDLATEVWLGNVQSVKACQAGLMLNVDTSAAAFVEPLPVAPHLVGSVYQKTTEQQLRQVRISTDTWEFRHLSRLLRGLKIEATHLGEKRRRHRVKGLVHAADTQSFYNEEEKKDMTVAEYFASKGTKLKYPNMPCVDVSTGHKARFLPMEFCRIVQGQKKTGKLSTKQTSAMIDISAQGPNVRKNNISQVLQSMSFEGARAFGIDVKKEMMQVKARVLPQPRLEYGEHQCLDVGTKGSWNLLHSKFLRGGALVSWAIVSLDERDQQYPGVNAFIQHLGKKLIDLGVHCKPPPRVAYLQGKSVYEHMEQGFIRAREHFGSPPQLLVVIIPVYPADQLYREVKLASDTKLGVPSQCIVSVRANLQAPNPDWKKQDQYCSNLAMKINAKIGGSICKLAGDPKDVIPVIGKTDFMVMGADVTHPTSRPPNPLEPSVAAVVGSLDTEFSQYASKTLTIGHREEIIPNLEGAIHELLQEYKRARNTSPRAIVFYRDGVADNQFQKCKSTEIPQIQKAFRSFGGEDYRPQLTFVVVQKRHNTRLFPIDNNRDDKSGNILPGTVVDTAICHPDEFDFYLNSHAGIKGTSKPAHYHVLLDENHFGADAMQMFTYWLCYMYCRCTRSVSYCPPAYYAHLAAARGKLMVAYPASSESSSESEGVQPGGESLQPTTSAIHERLRGRMYYV